LAEVFALAVIAAMQKQNRTFQEQPDQQSETTISLRTVHSFSLTPFRNSNRAQISKGDAEPVIGQTIGAFAANNDAIRFAMPAATERNHSWNKKKTLTNQAGILRGFVKNV